jgi:ribonuclease P protein component
VIARLVRSVDFERVLRTRSRISSAHFAVHHLAEAPSPRTKPARPAPAAAELSTGDVSMGNRAVDDLPLDAPTSAPATPPGAVWLGAVVPKRHARRSVTRTLLKRQIRAVVTGHAPTLPHGLWVVRVRAPFDKARFTSAASDELRRAAHAELDALIAGAALRSGGSTR